MILFYVWKRDGKLEEKNLSEIYDKMVSLVVLENVENELEFIRATELLSQKFYNKCFFQLDKKRIILSNCQIFIKYLK